MLQTGSNSVVVRLDGRVETLARAVEPVLADRGGRLAALPERERLLQRRTPRLQAADHVDELLAGGFVRRRVLSLLGHGSPSPWGWCWWSWHGCGRRRPAR